MQRARQGWRWDDDLKEIVVGSRKQRANVDGVTIVVTNAHGCATVLLWEVLLEENTFCNAAKGALWVKALVACWNRAQVRTVALVLCKEEGVFVMRSKGGMGLEGQNEVSTSNGVKSAAVVYR